MQSWPWCQCSISAGISAGALALSYLAFRRRKGDGKGDGRSLESDTATARRCVPSDSGSPGATSRSSNSRSAPLQGAVPFRTPFDLDNAYDSSFPGATSRSSNSRSTPLPQEGHRSPVEFPNAINTV